MTEKEQRDIFKSNLIRLVRKSGKSSKEIAESLGVSPQRFSTWLTGSTLPRIGMVEALAQFFNVQKSDLLDPVRPASGENLSEDESSVLAAYRSSSDEIKRAVKAVLGVES